MCRGTVRASAFSHRRSSSAAQLLAARCLQVFREAGARGFWRGAVPMFWCTPLQNALLFVGYGYGERISGTSETNSLTPVFIGGCVGGFVQSFVVSPAELLKVLSLRLLPLCHDSTPFFATHDKELTDSIAPLWIRGCPHLSQCCSRARFGFSWHRPLRAWWTSRMSPTARWEGHRP